MTSVLSMLRCTGIGSSRLISCIQKKKDMLMTTGLVVGVSQVVVTH